MTTVATHFIFTGFIQEMGFRVFGFKGVAADRTQTVYEVRAQLALAQRYGIRLQELPLLCRKVLEGLVEGEEKRAFTYTEEDMCLHASIAAAARHAAAQKRPPRRPPPNEAAAPSPWRGPLK